MSKVLKQKNIIVVQFHFQLSSINGNFKFNRYLFMHFSSKPSYSLKTLFLNKNKTFYLFLINTHFTYFHTTTNLNNLKDTEKPLDNSFQETFQRFKEGVRETKAICSKFSKFMGEFSVMWSDKNVKISIETYPTLANIREVIIQYPTLFLRLTTRLYISRITYIDIFRNSKFEYLPPQEKDFFYLVEVYDFDKLKFISDNYFAIEIYYKQNYYAYLNGCDTIDFSSLRLQSGFAGTSMYLNNFQIQLSKLIEKFLLKKSKKNSKISIHITNHLSTKLFFLTQFHKNFLNLNENSSITFDQFSYCDLPLDLVSFLTADLYSAIAYKEDFVDLFYQFLKINKVFNTLPYTEMRTIQLKTLKLFVENKTKLLAQWAEDYNIPEDFIIFCFENVLKGKSEDFEPLNILYRIEQKKQNIRHPSISTMFISLKYEIYGFLHSFYFRDCALVNILNYENLVNADSKLLSKKIAPFGLLNPIEVKDSLELFKQALNEDADLRNEYNKTGYIHRYSLLPILKKTGFPNFGSSYLECFNNFLMLIQKQIQKEIFKQLMEIFPQISELENGKNYYKFFYNNRNSNVFFIESYIFTAPKLDITDIFLHLHDKLKTTTGYELNFHEVDLVAQKTKFEKSIQNLNNKQDCNHDIDNFISHFTKISKDNLFLDFNTLSNENDAFTLSYLEIELVIESYFPYLVSQENLVKETRKKIVEILKLRGFSTKRKRVTIKIDLSNENINNKNKVTLERLKEKRHFTRPNSFLDDFFINICLKNKIIEF